MSKAQHSAGPWSVTDNSWEVSSVYGPAGNLIAQIRIDSDADEETQDDFEAIKEADARLIAASLDMLVALRPLVSIANAILGEAPATADNFSVFQDCAGHAHRVTMEELRAVVAAVAKAEGGAP